jgi:hypothetical protein
MGDKYAISFASQRGLPADVKWGIAVLVLLILQIVWILVKACPVVGMCFPFPACTDLLWPIIATSLAIWIAAMACGHQPRRRRVFRLLVAGLLAVFSIDSFTGGQLRWFELAMRWQMAKVGGPDALQRWAQGELETPQQIAALDEDAGGPLLASRTPANLKHWYGHFPPMYRLTRGGGPFFQFDNGGWDMGWGVIVGRTDLKDPWPVANPTNGRQGWVEELQPGVFLYSFP